MDEADDFPTQDGDLDQADHFNPEGGFTPPGAESWQPRRESPLGGANQPDAGKKADSSEKPRGQMPPIIERLQNLGVKEVQEEGKVALARQIGPAYTAFMDTAKDIPKPDLYVSGRLNALKNEALRAANRLHEQNVFPGQDLEFCFSKIIKEEVFPNLRDNEQAALTQASDQEAQRQQQKTSDGQGMSFSWKIPPDRMLKTLLWSIRDIQ
jgi:hypothetical protein